MEQLILLTYISLLGISLLMHLLVIAGLLPWSFLWGGRIKSRKQMYAFESVSVLINLFFLMVILIRGAYIPAILPMKVVEILLWLMFFLFLFNTIGNAFSLNKLERYLFTPLTLLLSLMSLILVVWF